MVVFFLNQEIDRFNLVRLTYIITFLEWSKRETITVHAPHPPSPRSPARLYFRVRQLHCNAIPEPTVRRIAILFLQVLYYVKSNLII